MAMIVRTSDDWEQELGHRVKVARKAADLTQEELANRANISLNTLKSLEGGNGSQLSTFIKVIRALDMDREFDALLMTSAVDPMALLLTAGRSIRKSS